MLRRIIDSLTQRRSSREESPFVGYAFEFTNKALEFQGIGFPYELLGEFESLDLQAEHVVKHLGTEIAVSEVNQDFPKLELHGGPDAESVLELLEFIGNNDSNAMQGLLVRQPKVLSSTHDDAGIPLLAAAAHGHGPIVELLVAHGADPDAPGPLGMSPLHWAAAFNHDEAVEALVKVGANGETWNWSMLSAAELALANRSADAYRSIRSNLSIRPEEPSHKLVLFRMIEVGAA